MGFLKKLLARNRAGKPVPEEKPEPAAALRQEENPEPAEAVYLTQTVIFGMHPYRSADEDSSVYFVDRNRGIRKMLIDSKGRIQSFPGMVKEDFWVKEVPPARIKPQVCFRSSFEKREKGWIFLWQLQPDGWYWADEGGFGGEHDAEVVLYTYLDDNGNFTGPFRLWQLGEVGYSLDRFLAGHERSAAQLRKAMTDDEDYRYCPADLFPQLLGVRTQHVSDRFYQLRSRQEAAAYWDHPMLSRDLVALAEELLQTEKPLRRILGQDRDRLKGSMTLFYQLTGQPVFRQVLDKFFEGNLEEFTLKRLEETGPQK